MRVNESLSKSHFTQLYFQAAKIRCAELTDFFSRGEEVHPGALDSEALEAAIDAAGELYEFLQRAGMYHNEARHMGEESYLQRQ